jgi:ketosteroid isomerase-like protein
MIPILGVALTTLVAWLGAVSTGQASDDVSTIVDLEQRLAQAWVKGDRTFIDALLAPDWTVTDPSGRVLTKQQVLDETFSSAERKIETMAVDDVKVRIIGAVAVATGRTRATGSYQGRSASVELRFTDVFVRQSGEWQIAVSQGTMVAP